MSTDHKRSHDSELQWKASHWHAADWGRAIKQSIGLQDRTVLNMQTVLIASVSDEEIVQLIIFVLQVNRCLSKTQVLITASSQHD